MCNSLSEVYYLKTFQTILRTIHLKKSVMKLHFESGLEHNLCNSLVHCTIPVLKIFGEKES